MLQKTEEKIDYLDQWPLHYYEVENINEREKYLKQILSQSPESKEDHERLNVLHIRYGHEKNGKRPDLFLRAWMNLKTASTEKTSFLNHRHKEKEIREYFTELCILNHERNSILHEEWKDFARTWITLCANSTSYRSAVFGMLKVSDQNTAMRIANDIDAITNLLPAEFGLQKECAEFRQILIDTYKSLLENGETYWETHLSI